MASLFSSSLGLPPLILPSSSSLPHPPLLILPLSSFHPLTKQTFAATLCTEPAPETASAPPPPAATPDTEAAAARASAARASLRADFRANLNEACFWLRRPFVEASTQEQRVQQRANPLLQYVNTADGPRWAPTAFGKAVYFGGLKPAEGVLLLHSLRQVSHVDPPAPPPHHKRP